MVTTPERTTGKGPIPEEPAPAGRLVLLGKRIAARRGVKHLIRAIGRYGDRLGSQFAGAMTYFSFLSLVPILMVGFSVGGIVLANNQDLLATLESQIAELLPAGIAEPIVELIDSVVANPLGVGIVGLLIALYSGIGWMGNLRKAIRALWGKKFETGKATADNLVVGTIKDLGALAGLAIAVTVSLALSAIGGQFTRAILGLFGLGDQPWLVPIVTVLTILIAMAADVLIFMWVYTILPPKSQRSPLRARLRGSIIAAIGFEILKYALTTILPAFTSTSRTAVIFGPIIGLLFFFNLVAQLVLFVAAWVATADDDTEDDDEPLPEVPEATVLVRKEPSRLKSAALLGVGAAVGWGAKRRRE
jgi:membrane protein